MKRYNTVIIILSFLTVTFADILYAQENEYRYEKEDKITTYECGDTTYVYINGKKSGKIVEYTGSFGYKQIVVYDNDNNCIYWVKGKL